MYLKSAALLLISVLLFDVVDAGVNKVGPTVKPPSFKQSCGKKYTIKAGDKCYVIWQKYKLTAAQWHTLNPNVNCNNLQLKQVVCVSSSSSSPSAPQKPTQSSSASSGTGTNNVCRSYTDQFKQASRIVSEEDYKGDPKTADWIDISGDKRTWTLGPNGLEMRVLSPGKVVTSKGANNKAGQGATLNSTYELNFGSVEAKIKMNPIPGIVTAFITMSNEGDEIDWEWVGGDLKRAQSNFFGMGFPDYTQSITHPIAPAGNPGGAPIDNSKEWGIFLLELQPDYVRWSINGNIVRTLNRNATKRFPYHKTRVQLGIWDSSDNAGTTQWANGPVKWNSLGKYLSAFVEYVKIECDPRHNKVIS